MGDAVRVLPGTFFGCPAHLISPSREGQQGAAAVLHFFRCAHHALSHSAIGQHIMTVNVRGQLQWRCVFAQAAWQHGILKLRGHLCNIWFVPLPAVVCLALSACTTGVVGASTRTMQQQSVERQDGWVDVWLRRLGAETHAPPQFHNETVCVNLRRRMNFIVSQHLDVTM